MNLYRFSPIQSEDELIAAVVYVAETADELAASVTQGTFSIHSLTIFAHYPDEFVFLSELVKKMGQPFDENNGPRVVLNEPIKVGKNTITHLRIRHPDPYRMQVGCCDFDSPYEWVKQHFLTDEDTNTRLIKRPEYEMIEFFHPDFDVLAYVVSK